MESDVSGLRTRVVLKTVSRMPRTFISQLFAVDTVVAAWVSLGSLSYAACAFFLQQYTFALSNPVDEQVASVDWTFRLQTAAFGAVLLLNVLNLGMRQHLLPFKCNLLLLFINGVAFMTDVLLWRGATPLTTSTSGRVFAPLRYVQWCHSTPTMIYMLALLADYGGWRLTVSVLSDVAMVMTGLAACLTSGLLKFTFTLVSFGTFAVVLVFVCDMFHRTLSGDVSPEQRSTLRTVQVLLVALWSAFPVVWLAADWHLIGSGAEAVAWGVCDYLAKVVFSSQLWQSNLTGVQLRQDRALEAWEASNRVEAVARLTALLRQRDDLLSTLSHELRTPLAGIIALTESLYQDVAAVMPTGGHTLATVRATATCMLNIVTSTLDSFAVRRGETAGGEGLLDDQPAALGFRPATAAEVARELDAVELRPLIETVASVLRPLAHDGVAVVNDLPVHLPLVYADATRLSQVLYNLVGNAMRFTSQGEVRITARVLIPEGAELPPAASAAPASAVDPHSNTTTNCNASGDATAAAAATPSVGSRWRNRAGRRPSSSSASSSAGSSVGAPSWPPGTQVEVSVEDTGVGIPQDLLDELFQPYRTGLLPETLPPEMTARSGRRKDGSKKSSPSAIGGTGLGLYLVRLALRAQGSDISAESAPGLGSVFRFRLASVPHDATGGSQHRQLQRSGSRKQAEAEGKPPALRRLQAAGREPQGDDPQAEEGKGCGVTAGRSGSRQLCDSCADMREDGSHPPVEGTPGEEGDGQQQAASSPRCGSAGCSGALGGKTGVAEASPSTLSPFTATGTSPVTSRSPPPLPHSRQLARLRRSLEEQRATRPRGLSCGAVSACCFARDLEGCGALGNEGTRGGQECSPCSSCAAAAVCWRAATGVGGAHPRSGPAATVAVAATPSCVEQNFRHRNNGTLQVMSVDDDPINQLVAGQMLTSQSWKVIKCMNGPEALAHFHLTPNPAAASATADAATTTSGDGTSGSSAGGTTAAADTSGNTAAVLAAAVAAARPLLPSILPDCVLLDVMMPGMSGFEVCRQLRQHFTSAQLPIIIVSAKGDAAAVEEAFDSGADDYMTKPYKRTEMVARIKAQMRTRDSMRTAPASSVTAAIPAAPSAPAAAANSPAGASAPVVPAASSSQAALPLSLTMTLTTPSPSGKDVATASCSMASGFPSPSQLLAARSSATADRPPTADVMLLPQRSIGRSSTRPDSAAAVLQGSTVRGCEGPSALPVRKRGSSLMPADKVTFVEAAGSGRGADGADMGLSLVNGEELGIRLLKDPVTAPVPRLEPLLPGPLMRSAPHLRPGSATLTAPGDSGIRFTSAVVRKDMQLLRDASPLSAEQSPGSPPLPLSQQRQQQQQQREQHAQQQEFQEISLSGVVAEANAACVSGENLMPELNGATSSVAPTEATLGGGLGGDATVALLQEMLSEVRRSRVLEADVARLTSRLVALQTACCSLAAERDGWRRQARDLRALLAAGFAAGGTGTQPYGAPGPASAGATGLMRTGSLVYGHAMSNGLSFQDALTAAQASRSSADDNSLGNVNPALLAAAAAANGQGAAAYSMGMGTGTGMAVLGVAGGNGGISVAAQIDDLKREAALLRQQLTAALASVGHTTSTSTGFASAEAANGRPPITTAALPSGPSAGRRAPQRLGGGSVVQRTDTSESSPSGGGGAGSDGTPSWATTVIPNPAFANNAAELFLATVNSGLSAGSAGGTAPRDSKCGADGRPRTPGASSAMPSAPLSAVDRRRATPPRGATSPATDAVLAEAAAMLSKSQPPAATSTPAPPAAAPAPVVLGGRKSVSDKVGMLSIERASQPGAPDGVADAKPADSVLAAAHKTVDASGTSAGGSSSPFEGGAPSAGDTASHVAVEPIASRSISGIGFGTSSTTSVDTKLVCQQQAPCSRQQQQQVAVSAVSPAPGPPSSSSPPRPKSHRARGGGGGGGGSAGLLRLLCSKGATHHEDAPVVHGSSKRQS